MKLKKVLKQMLTFSFASMLAVGAIGCTSTAEPNSQTPGATTDAAITQTLDKDALIVGLDDNFPPMGFKDETGELVGFDIDVAKAIGEKLGKEMKFQSIDWSMKETELNSGNIDLIWNGYSITDDRKELVLFSTPYLENKQIILTLAGSDIKTKADLSGKVVGAQNESSAVSAMEGEAAIYASFDGGKAVTYENNNDALMDLEAGRVDALVADEILIKYYISKKGVEKYNILDEDFGSEEYGVGMRLGEEALAEAFNTAYADLKADGTLKTISEKWFGDDISK